MRTASRNVWGISRRGIESYLSWSTAKVVVSGEVLTQQWLKVAHLIWLLGWKSRGSTNFGSQVPSTGPTSITLVGMNDPIFACLISSSMFETDESCNWTVAVNELWAWQPDLGSLLFPTHRFSHVFARRKHYSESEYWPIILPAINLEVGLEPSLLIVSTTAMALLKCLARKEREAYTFPVNHPSSVLSMHNPKVASVFCSRSFCSGVQYTRRFDWLLSSIASDDEKTRNYCAIDKILRLNSFIIDYQEFPNAIGSREISLWSSPRLAKGCFSWSKQLLFALCRISSIEGSRSSTREKTYTWINEDKEGCRRTVHTSNPVPKNIGY